MSLTLPSACRDSEARDGNGVNQETLCKVRGGREHWVIARKSSAAEAESQFAKLRCSSLVRANLIHLVEIVIHAPLTKQFRIG